MSIQGEIDRIRGHVASVYEAVAAKGGTLPNTQTSANMFQAVQSIPTGVTVKVTPGEFDTEGGLATVNCGFQPDLVYITQGYNYNYNNKSWLVSVGLDFAHSASANVYATFWNIDDEVTDFYANRTTNGFTLEAVAYDSALSPSAYDGDFNYIAVKFT